MCNASSSRHNIHVSEKIEDDQFYADPSFIIKKSFFRYVKGHPREEFVPSWPDPHECIYPKSNSYYAFLEDTNPFTRFSSKCESRKYGNVRPHFEPPKEPYTIRDPYFENDAKKEYLRSTPTCFVILGKPDLNTSKLATMIADSWHCVLISPMSLVKDEIDRGTEKGTLLADILKAGERLGPRILMNLIVDRLNKRDVFHRGYVVEGLPLIPNEILDYSSYPSFPYEASNLQNTFQKLSKFFESSFELLSNSKVDFDDFPILFDEEWKPKSCQVTQKYERFIFNQIEDIFTTWPIRPSVIIYAICPDEDAIRKREEFRIDPITGRIVDTTLAEMSKNIDTIFSRNQEENMNISSELYQELMNEERIFDEHQTKYLLKRLSDSKLNVELQCKLYKRFALPAIEKCTLLHNPQNVIRVDGRTPVSRMFQIIVARLRTLCLPRVILPKRYTNHFEFEGESPRGEIDLTDEFDGKSNEEAYQDLTNRETISPLYPWQLSPWKFFCPVELIKGRTVEGVPKHAVRFMNNLFFLSSSEAVDLFIDNPRTFLYPFSPRPTCKIAVFGPRYSGKSDLCRKLAQMFRGMVINVNEIEKSLVNFHSDTSIYSLDHATIEEKTDSIVKNIQDVPKEEVDIDIWRDGGYILDGMCPKIDSWRKIVEDSKIIFEDVVLLFDEDPYDYLIAKWRCVHETKEYTEFEGEYNEYMEDIINRSKEEEEEGSQGLIEYLEHIRQFEQDWEELKEIVSQSSKNLITCNLKQVSDVSDYVVKHIKSRYTEKPRIMSEEEKEKERDLMEYMALSDTENINEEEEQEGERRTVEFVVQDDNNRFGDTSYYCPLTLLRYNVLRKARRVPVPDSRFDYLCEYFKPVSKVPAFLNVVDIAGLVKGAAEGQGLGNSFLSHINACDGIFHLCRAFVDDDVTHVEGDVDPVRDLEIISEELRLKDIEFLNGHLEKLEKLVVRGNDKKLKPEYDTLLKVKGVMVDEKRHIRFADWSATDIEVLNKYLFLTSKPVIYLVNLSEKDYIRKKNKWLIKIKEWVDKNDPGAILIPFSGVFENKLISMEPEERAKYLEENKVTSALDKIIVQGYKALQLQYFFTAGHDEVKAWTIQKGTKAPQAAGKIHTDFEKGFIMAEVMKFDDFKNEGSEAAVKAAGKYRQQGRNYVVEDGDIIFFKFNAGAGLKDAKKK